MSVTEHLQYFNDDRWISLVSDQLMTVEEFLTALNCPVPISSFRIQEVYDAHKSTKQFILIDKEWLDIMGYKGEYKNQRQHFLELLTKNFTPELDYKIIGTHMGANSNQPIKAGRKSKNIYLSYVCLKEIMMMLYTEKSKEIRRRYILQEALFSAYVAYQTEFCKRENERRVETEKKELEEKIQQGEEKVQEVTSEKDAVMKLHRRNLMRRKYWAFGKTGPGFYIIVDKDTAPLEHYELKFGIFGYPKRKNTSSNSKTEVTWTVNQRLDQHRTLWTEHKVALIVYTPIARDLENFIRHMYRERIEPSGKEVIKGVPAASVVFRAMRFLEEADSQSSEPSFHVEENIEKYNQGAVNEKECDSVPDKVITTEEQIANIERVIGENNINVNEMLKSIGKMTVPKLKELCGEMGLRKGGKKQEIIDRINGPLNVISKKTVILPRCGCGEKLEGNHKMCKTCHILKIHPAPPLDDIIKANKKNQSLSSLGKFYGVRSTTIKCWLKFYNCELK
jgi:hypothetical protein